jgi:hypothetical protein
MSAVTRTLSFALPLALLPAISFAANDAVRNAAERSQDHQQIRADRAATTDDTADRAQIENLLADFRVARKSADAAALAALDARVEGYFESELGEADAKVAAAGQEVRQDRREVRSDRREVLRNRRDGACIPARVDDRHDLTGDRRDRRDDRRDSAVGDTQRTRIADLRDEWVGLPDDPSNRKALARKEALLEEMASIARAEIGQDVRENAEDHRELREDRRETREDRRQG